jgi:hypothetical protein
MRARADVRISTSSLVFVCLLSPQPLHSWSGAHQKVKSTKLKALTASLPRPSSAATMAMTASARRTSKHSRRTSGCRTSSASSYTLSTKTAGGGGNGEALIAELLVGAAVAGGEEGREELAEEGEDRRGRDEVDAILRVGESW